MSLKGAFTATQEYCQLNVTKSRAFNNKAKIVRIFFRTFLCFQNMLYISHRILHEIELQLSVVVPGPQIRDLVNQVERHSLFTSTKVISSY